MVSYLLVRMATNLNIFRIKGKADSNSSGKESEMPSALRYGRLGGSTEGYPATQRIIGLRTASWKWDMPNHLS